MGKVWVLDTETKGTGANMVPLEKVQAKQEPRRSTGRRAKASEGRVRQRPPKRAGRSETSSTPLPAGHVRKKGTGEIGRIQSVDAKAGTASVRWLKRGAVSTVPLSAVSRR
jgi:hypothetical protein